MTKHLKSKRSLGHVRLESFVGHMSSSPTRGEWVAHDSNGRSRVTGFRYNRASLAADIRHALESLNWEKFIKSDSRVFVKPNFALPFYKPGVTTTESVLEATLGILKDRASEVYVGESDGGADSFTADYSLRNHGIPEICRRTGATMLNLSAGQRKRIRETSNGRTVEVTLPSQLLEMDESISIPVLKVHAVTQVSLSIKNMWGCHPDGMRLFDHKHLAERLALISKLVRLRFVVVDAIYGLNRRGPMHGDPVKVGVILVGDNPVATDATATRLMGFRADQVRHIVAASRAGLGPYQESNIELLEDLTPFQRSFYLKSTGVDILGAWTFRSDYLTRLVFGSPVSELIYKLVGRKFRKKIFKSGDEF